MKNAIAIDRLSVSFSDTPVFKALSLSVIRGEKVTITGPSGSGKSTLLRCVMGFTPITSGRIEILGEELSAANIWQLRGKMAYVAQEPAPGEGVVRDTLCHPFTYRINHALSYNETEVLTLFELFHLAPALLDKKNGTLSGGEKQRIALIAALLLHRPLLLLDEAASALDNTTKQGVREYLRNRKDLTILSVSHDIRDFSLSDSVIDITQLKNGASP